MSDRYLTFRFILERAVIEALAEEPEFLHDITLHAHFDVKPVPDHFLAVFVYRTEPWEDGTTKAWPVSTSVFGIQRYTTKRLSGQGTYVTDRPPSDGILMQTLRAHFRAEAALLQERLTSSASSIPIRWTSRLANGAGDADVEPFTILDPDVDALHKLFSLPDPRSNDPLDQEDE